MELNLRVLRERLPEHPSVGRFDEVAARLTGDRDARAEDGIRWVRELRDALGVPGLRAYVLAEAEVPAPVGRAREASSM